ncbi:MAG: glycosyltransferase family 4 protein [Candidatus Latescibacterota bacterium]
MTQEQTVAVAAPAARAAEAVVQRPHLVWVVPADLTLMLSAATYLDTTRYLRTLGWRVTLVSMGPAERRQIRGIEVLCIPAQERYFVGKHAWHVAVRRFLRQHRDDVDVVLFLEESVPWLLPLRWRRALSGATRPLLVMDTRSVHMPPPQRQRLRIRLRGAYTAVMTWLGNHAADGRTVITPRMATAVRVPPRRVWGIWPSGVDPAPFAAAAARRRWPGPDEPIRLIYLGSLEFERNLLAVCQAVRQANAEGLRFELVLIGAGPQKEALEALAAAPGSGVRVLPPVPHPEVPGALAQVHMGVLPFPDEEKFLVSSFVKLFEYMASGLVVLATRIGCHTDVVGDGRYAIWAEGSRAEDLLAALRQAWQERHTLAARGAEGMAASGDWTWEATARKLSQALQTGLRRAGGGAGLPPPAGAA